MKVHHCTVAQTQALHLPVLVNPLLWSVIISEWPFAGWAKVVKGQNWVLECAEMLSRCGSARVNMAQHACFHISHSKLVGWLQAHVGHTVHLCPHKHHVIQFACLLDLLTATGQ